MGIYGLVRRADDGARLVLLSTFAEGPRAMEAAAALTRYNASADYRVVHVRDAADLLDVLATAD